MSNPKQRLQEFLENKNTREYVFSTSAISGEQGVFVGDGLVAYGRMLGFLADKKFRSSFDRALARYETQSMKPVLESIIWRKHSLLWAARNALNIEGDFVECGVDYGFGVDVVSDYLDFSSYEKKWFLFDTYSGVPESQLDDGFVGSHNEETLKQFEEVCSKFSNQENIVPVQGMLPDILDKSCPEKIAFLHIDLNNARGEIETFFRLYPLVSIGGYVVFDDYGAFLFAKQHISERYMFDMLEIPVLELPTGQAVIIKTREVDFSSIDVDMCLNVYNEDSRPSNWPEAVEVPDQKIIAEVENAVKYYNELLSQVNANMKLLRQNTGLNDSSKFELLQSSINRLNSVEVDRQDGIVRFTFQSTIESKDIALFRSRFQEYIDEVVSIHQSQQEYLGDNSGASQGKSLYSRLLNSFKK